MGLNIGKVPTFQGVQPTKEQALKPLEESAEAFSAWQLWDNEGGGYHEREAILEECADVIQAACNLIVSLGVTDFTYYMQRCEARNRQRGREYAQL